MTASGQARFMVSYLILQAGISLAPPFFGRADVCFSLFRIFSRAASSRVPHPFVDADPAFAGH
jgi:hypothetical protein